MDLWNWNPHPRDILGTCDVSCVIARDRAPEMGARRARRVLAAKDVVGGPQPGNK
jgi:hypothetical protein